MRRVDVCGRWQLTRPRSEGFAADPSGEAGLRDKFVTAFLSLVRGKGARP